MSIVGGEKLNVDEVFDDLEYNCCWKIEMTAMSRMESRMRKEGLDERLRIGVGGWMMKRQRDKMRKNSNSLEWVI